jgi:hypothetical protein
MAKTKKTRQRLDLTRRLAVYSAAVGAGLVGTNRADAAIHSSTGLSIPFGGVADYYLTMEGDEAELLFRGTGTSPLGWFGVSAGSQVRFFTTAVFTGHPMAGQLATGALISPTTNTPAAIGPARFREATTGGSAGAWDVDNERGLMGFSFPSEGPGNPTRYGWAEIERVDGRNGILRGWGYEDSGAPIAAGDTGGAVPEPSGLALLALGAAGVATFRRRRSAV